MKKYLSFGKVGHILLEMILSWRYALEKNHLLSLVHFVSNKKCVRKKSKLYVLVISKTSLEQRHCTAANAAKNEM